MTISGEMIKRDQWSYWLVDGSACLAFSGAGVAFFLFIMHLIGGTVDPTLRIAAISAFPLLGLVGVSFLIWDDRHTVVEFQCDDECLEFRKLGNPQREIRLLGEIDRLSDRPSKQGTVLIGTSVIFRDGSRIFVPFGGNLPNADELVEHLNNRSQSVTPPLPQPVDVSASTT